MNNPWHHPVKPFPITQKASAAELIERMGGTAFQARSLARGTDIWARMLGDKVTILFGLAGAMIPAGMREIMVYLIENRLIDCLVSTGANLFHDLHESLGNFHWQGSHQVSDEELREAQINRIYDVFAREKEFFKTDSYIADFAEGLEQGRPYTTREYFYLLGKKLIQEGRKEGILTAAAKSKLPIYCPALGDSSFGIAMAEGRFRRGQRMIFDVIQDVLEITKLAMSSPATGVVYVGGGTPKNFIQQAEVTALVVGQEMGGHKYAIQITTDSPQWGGLSGCTFEEAQSWKKIDTSASTVTVNADATIALPLIVSALAETCTDAIAQRPKPDFIMAQELEFRIES